jgi:hypothetical protein
LAASVFPWPGPQIQSKGYLPKALIQVLLLHANNCVFAPKISERKRNNSKREHKVTDQITGLEQASCEEMDPGADRLNGIVTSSGA